MTPLEDARARLEARIRMPWPEPGGEPRPRAWGWADGASVNDDDAIDTLIEAAKQEALQTVSKEVTLRAAAGETMVYCAHCDFEQPDRGDGIWACPKCTEKPPFAVHETYKHGAIRLRSQRQGDPPRLTSAGARSLLKTLTEFFGEPVMQMSRYCSAFALWLEAIEKLNVGEKKGTGEEWAPHIRSILLSISKSNLLGRLLYDGEQFRTRPCPTHEGTWSGLDFNVVCPHGCQGTGWLPEPK